LPPQAYDLITSRAVTDTKMLMQLSEPYRQGGSLLLFYKGEKVYDEVSELSNYKIIEMVNRHYLLIES
jgi:16S rRNA (guanine527-N7)-methyltransferase